MTPEELWKLRVQLEDPSTPEGRAGRQIAYLAQIVFGWRGGGAAGGGPRWEAAGELVALSGAAEGGDREAGVYLSAPVTLTNLLLTVVELERRRSAILAARVPIAVR